MWRNGWHDFTRPPNNGNATDRQKLQAFLNSSKRSGFCDSETDDFATLCSTADKQLFNRILYQPEHVLHPLLPPPMPPNTIFVTDHTTGYFVNVLPDWLIVILSLECYIMVICRPIDWLYVHFTALCFSHVEVRFDISVIKELIDWLIDWVIHRYQSIPQLSSYTTSDFL